MALGNLDLNELSWEKSLLLKSVILVLGVIGVLWQDWPLPPNDELRPDLPTVVVSQPHEFQVSNATSVSHLASKKQAVHSASTFQTYDRYRALSVDLNSSSQEVLETLPGIGPVLADRIVTYRSTNGNFQRIDELVNVSGIGIKRLQRLQPFVKVEATVKNLGS